MPNAYETGAMFSDSLSTWKRTYYEDVLMDTLRMRSILTPYVQMKVDLAAKNTGQMVFTEVYDMEPNWNPVAESTIWLSGGTLDTRSITLALESYGDVMKYSDYAGVLNYLNRGDLKGLVQNKIGQSVIDTMDILARNAFLAHPHVKYMGGLRASRAAILATDLFDADLAELARTHLEESEVPGVQAVEDGGGQTIVCVTTPRVIHDIRVGAGSNWIEVQEYAGAARKFTSEVGTWGGVRFVKSSRNVLYNYGAVIAQTTLDGATVKGQGAAQTVDGVYTPGQPSATRYITVDDVTGFAVGQRITIHSKAVTLAGAAPVESDGTQETRRIESIDAGNKRIALDKPLLKEHADEDFVTHGVNLHASMFMGGPAVCLGIGERPTPVSPPKFDDRMMINRLGWRGFMKFQNFRPEFTEIHLTSGSTN